MAETDDIFLERVDSNGEIARLRLVDYGGVGPIALLLHGLAGAAHEWRDTAAWLCETHHVYALDQRGHGGSSKRLASFARAEFICDAVATIESIASDPVSLVGQSHGGVTAFLVAARHPELISRLIVIEAGIACDPDAPASIAVARYVAASISRPRVGALIFKRQHERRTRLVGDARRNGRRVSTRIRSRRSKIIVTTGVGSRVRYVSSWVKPAGWAANPSR